MNYCYYVYLRVERNTSKNPNKWWPGYFKENSKGYWLAKPKHQGGNKALKSLKHSLFWGEGEHFHKNSTSSLKKHLCCAYNVPSKICQVTNQRKIIINPSEQIFDVLKTMELRCLVGRWPIKKHTEKQKWTQIVLQLPMADILRRMEYLWGSSPSMEDPMSIKIRKSWKSILISSTWTEI